MDEFKDENAIYYNSSIFGDGEGVFGVAVATPPTPSTPNFTYVDDTPFLFADNTQFEFIAF